MWLNVFVLNSVLKNEIFNCICICICISNLSIANLICITWHCVSNGNTIRPLKCMQLPVATSITWRFSFKWYRIVAVVYQIDENLHAWYNKNPIYLAHAFLGIDPFFSLKVAPINKKTWAKSEVFLSYIRQWIFTSKMNLEMLLLILRLRFQWYFQFDQNTPLTVLIFDDTPTVYCINRGWIIHIYTVEVPSKLVLLIP